MLIVIKWILVILSLVLGVIECKTKKEFIVGFSIILLYIYCMIEFITNHHWYTITQMALFISLYKILYDFSLNDFKIKPCLKSLVICMILIFVVLGISVNFNTSDTVVAPKIETIEVKSNSLSISNVKEDSIIYKTNTITNDLYTTNSDKEEAVYTYEYKDSTGQKRIDSVPKSSTNINYIKVNEQPHLDIILIETYNVYNLNDGTIKNIKIDTKTKYELYIHKYDLLFASQ